MTTNPPPRARQPSALYIHVPFCRHRCGYCNFTLVANRDYLVPDYLRALQREMQQVDPPLPLETVYLGGGTPSRLSAGALASLLGLIDRYFPLHDDCEFTIEANPEDLPGRIGMVIESSRINRISLGVQSFQAGRLRLLDRDHTAGQIQRAIEFARRTVAGLSLDLIFGVPGDTAAIWKQDLENAIDSGAGHLSTYELTIEKGTRFWNRQQKRQVVRGTDDELADLYELTLATLGPAGLAQYEVSSFARPGQRSRHNQVYWSGDSWIGLGPGAAGLLNQTRYTNHRSVTRYLREVLAHRSAREESWPLSRAEWVLDQIVFGLRRLQGVDLRDWTTRTGFSLSAIVQPGAIESLKQSGLLDRSTDTLKLTRAGLLHGDYVCQQLLNAALPADRIPEKPEPPPQIT